MEKDGSKIVNYVYETLDPLGFSGDHDLDDSWSYAVFRNEITVSADLAADIPVFDYFSLDASSNFTLPDLDDPPALQSATAAWSPEVVRPAATESAWFRAGSRFRSPMLQLHKVLNLNGRPVSFPSSDSLQVR
ncbi:hypothetical protein KSP40_PGU006373 [Platanthera guangdongensis]|uniref:Uncharacterized protein n=1 Tax=Platanthera guangdongensis TaxID=2320717 RepID=A0ABR2MFV9_9ASPA